MDTKLFYVLLVIALIGIVLGLFATITVVKVDNRVMKLEGKTTTNNNKE